MMLGVRGLGTFLLGLSGSFLLRAFDKECRNAVAAQEVLLNQILRENKETVFGAQHRFGRIKTFDEFQGNVPIAQYEDLEPYITAEMEGRRNQLTKQKPILYGKTSGTTGACKYIPITPESRKGKAKVLYIWVAGLQRDHRAAFSNSVLPIVSPEEVSRTPDGTPVGSESGHGYRNAPRLVRNLYACPYETFTIENYRAKYYMILLFSIQRRLSLIYTVNPSTLVLFAQLLAEYSELLIKDVADGTIAIGEQLAPAVRKELQHALRPQRARAVELEGARRKGGGGLTPALVWPELTAIACWTGGTVGRTYLDDVRAAYSAQAAIRDIGYYSTEARASVPLWDNTPNGVLTVSVNVYEFWPEGEQLPFDGRLLTLKDLEAGKKYKVFLTTSSGLYRYNMNDIVEASGWYGGCPVVFFVRKAEGIVSFTGEKVTENHVLRAVETLREEADVPSEFIAAVGKVKAGQPYYRFLMEFDHPPAENKLQTWAASLDEALSSNNIEYADKRKSGRLGGASVAVVRPGELRRYRMRRAAGSGADAQFKFLRVTDDPAFEQEFFVEREVGSEVGIRK